MQVPSKEKLRLVKCLARTAHLESCGRRVAALNRVGEACVNHFSESRLYVSITDSMSSPWMPTETRISMCCGRSTTFPSILSR